MVSVLLQNTVSVHVDSVVSMISTKSTETAIAQRLDRQSQQPLTIMKLHLSVYSRSK